MQLLPLFPATPLTAPTPDQSIFRAYDIRGIVETQLTPDLAESIGQAIGTQAHRAGETAIAVGADCRLSSPALTDALTRGLNNCGLEVIALGQTPSPLLYFATNYLQETHSGVVVTASHNPPEYNGFKIVLNGQSQGGKSIQQIYQRVLKGDFHRAASPGGTRSLDIAQDYMDNVCERVQLQRPLKVVVDAGNSVCGSIAPQLYRMLGCEVTELYCEPDGTFPNHPADPANPENLRDLQRAVLAEGADIGLAMDGDGDRLGVVTKQGDIVSPDRYLLLFVREILARRPGSSIIFDIKCSPVLEQCIEAYGGRPVVSPSGHSIIKAHMLEENACLAGELSGHIFFEDRWFGFDDGLYSGARLLEILAASEQTLSELLAAFPADISTRELEISVPEERKAQLAQRFVQMGAPGEGRVNLLDGIRVDSAESWGLLRASNTSPKLVCRFGGTTTEAMHARHLLFQQQLQAIDPSLQIPAPELFA